MLKKFVQKTLSQHKENVIKDNELKDKILGIPINQIYAYDEENHSKLLRFLRSQNH